MHYVLARSALLLTGAGGAYFLATDGDVPLWFIGLGAVTQIIFFVVKRNFKADGEEQFRVRSAQRYANSSIDSNSTLEERMLAAADAYKRTTNI